jgi:hypothetical protein
MTTNNSRQSFLNADQKMIDGINQFFANVPSLTIGGQQLAPAALVKILQDRIATGKAAVAAHAAAATAVLADRQKRADTRALLAAFKRLVRGMFASPDVLAAFGLTPVRAGKKTVATKAGAIAANKATRTARKTMGPKQKKGVKGQAPAKPAA